MGYPHTKYPPGFPLLLAPIEFLFGDHVLLMRLLVALCAVASVGATYALFRRVANARVALAVSVMTAASFALLIEATRILSDVAYLLFSLVALHAAVRYREDLTVGRAVAAIALIVAAYSIRIVGFTLAPALAAGILLDATTHGAWRWRARHAAAVLATVAVVMGAWMGRNALVSRGLPTELREALSYEDEFRALDPSDPHSARARWGDIVARVSSNVPHYRGLLANLLSGRRVQDARIASGLALLWLAGWAIALARRRSVVEFYTLLYALVYLLWPSWQGERFLVPILPMVFYYALEPLRLAAKGAGTIADRLLSPGQRRWAPAAEGVLLIAAMATVVALNGKLDVYVIREQRKTPYYTGAMADYLAAFGWVKANTPADAVVITDRAPYGVFLTGRRTFTFPWVTSHSEVLASIARVGGTHAIATDFGYSQRYLNPVIAAHPELFREVHRIGASVVYEVRP
jgi:4-amino-4-deoxy-L-arabinose transferase-like glycosyltransferase